MESKIYAVSTYQSGRYEQELVTYAQGMAYLANWNSSTPLVLWNTRTGKDIAVATRNNSAHGDKAVKRFLGE
jgi:hypothetical protein